VQQNLSRRPLQPIDSSGLLGTRPMDVGLVLNHINLVCIMYVFYVFDDLSFRFHIICLASLTLGICCGFHPFVLVYLYFIDNIDCDLSHQEMGNFSQQLLLTMIPIGW
jgi:hypothetical protein